MQPNGALKILNQNLISIRVHIYVNLLLFHIRKGTEFKPLKQEISCRGTYPLAK